MEAQAGRDETEARKIVLADEARARSFLEHRESVLAYPFETVNATTKAREFYEKNGGFGCLPGNKMILHQLRVGRA